MYTRAHNNEETHTRQLFSRRATLPESTHAHVHRYTTRTNSHTHTHNAKKSYHMHLCKHAAIVFTARDTVGNAAEHTHAHMHTHTSTHVHTQTQAHIRIRLAERITCASTRRLFSRRATLSAMPLSTRMRLRRPVSSQSSSSDGLNRSSVLNDTKIFYIRK